MPAGTAFSSSLESNVLNLTLRGGTLAVATSNTLTYTSGTGATLMPLFLAFLTTATNDGTLVELAAAGAYATRPAFNGTTGQQFSTGAGTNVASSGGSALVNASALTFTASGAANNGIVGIAICYTNTVNTVSSAMNVDPSVLYYGDLTGGSVSLAIGQAITFAAGAISVTLD
jgi:hypothetical protein